MIKINTIEKTVRETMAPFELSENGKNRTEQIRVQYKSFTVKEMKQRRAKYEAEAKANPDAVVWLSDTLAEKLIALPDLLDDKEKPVEITVEFLDTLEVRNLEAIKKAIEDDEDPAKKLQHPSV